MSGRAQHGIDRVCPFKEKASPGGDDLLMLQPESGQQGVPPCICLPVGCVALFSAENGKRCHRKGRKSGSTPVQSKAPTLSSQSRCGSSMHYHSALRKRKEDPCTGKISE